MRYCFHFASRYIDVVVNTYTYRYILRDSKWIISCREIASKRHKYFRRYTVTLCIHRYLLSSWNVSSIRFLFSFYFFRPPYCIIMPIMRQMNTKNISVDLYGSKKESKCWRERERAGECAAKGAPGCYHSKQYAASSKQQTNYKLKFFAQIQQQ